MLKRTTHQLGIKDEHLDDSGYQWFLAVENGELTATLFTDHEPTNVTEPTIYDFMENDAEKFITMEMFRKEDSLGNLSEDDRIEIFCDILKGSSDVTRENLDAMGLRYGVDIADLYKDATEYTEEDRRQVATYATIALMDKHKDFTNDIGSMEYEAFQFVNDFTDKNTAQLVDKKEDICEYHDVQCRVAQVLKLDTQAKAEKIQESADKAEIMKRRKALSHHLGCPINTNADRDYPDEFQIGMQGYEVVTKAVAINNRFDCDDEFDDVVDFVVAYVTDDCVEGMYNRMKDSDYFVREL